MEYQIEPILSSKGLNSPHNVKKSGGKAKKSGKMSVAKSPSSIGEGANSKPSPAPVDGPDLEQAIALAAQASQCAKTQPETAYKLFARAGQVFARHYRTQEAARSYFYVSQLQTGLLRAKLAEIGCSSTVATFSILGCLSSKEPEVHNSVNQLIAGFSVLFKSHLYLARLMRPHDDNISIKSFWNSLDVIIPNQAWNDMQSILSGSPPVFRALPGESHSTLAQLTQYCQLLVLELKPAVQFVDEQRSQAAAGKEFLSFWREISIVVRELACFICAREGAFIGIALLEISSQLEHTYSSPEDATTAEILTKNLEWQSDIFSSLKQPHWQVDCLVEASFLHYTEEARLQNLTKALTLAIQKSDESRMERILKATAHLLSTSPPPQHPLHFLLNLTAVQLKGDCLGLERLNNDPWAHDAVREDALLASLFGLVKTRL
jgi:hypothetical protein